MPQHEITLRKFQGMEISVRNHRYLLVNFHSEKTYRDVGVRQAVFFAQRAHDGLPVVIKFRIEMDRENILRPIYRKDAHEMVKKMFRDEIQVLQDTASLRSTPKLLDQEAKTQDMTYENPGGYLLIIAMSRMPGRPATEYSDLSDTEGIYIKRELMQILEEIRSAGWYMLEGFPDKIIYERSTRKVSLTCLAHAQQRDPSLMTYRFTEDNSVLHNFGQNLWWM